MAQISILRTARAAARITCFSARDVHQAAVDECAASYSDERWDLIGRTESAYRASRAALDQAEAELLHAELVNVQVRKAA